MSAGRRQERRQSRSRRCGDGARSIEELVAPAWHRSRREFTPRDAVRKQLSVDAEPAGLDGIRAAMRRATPAQSLAIALEIAEPRLLRLAAEEVARKPQLLKEVDFAAVSAQAIWAQAMAINPQAWRGPLDPQKSFAAIIQNLLEGGPAIADLIAALATSSARRSQLFSTSCRGLAAARQPCPS